MPPISSHTLRHTGCIRLGENNVNPKVIEKSHVENEMSKMNLPENRNTRGVALLSAYTKYSNVLSLLTFFLNSFHFPFCYELVSDE